MGSCWPWDRLDSRFLRPRHVREAGSTVETKNLQATSTRDIWHEVRPWESLDLGKASSDAARIYHQRLQGRARDDASNVCRSYGHIQDCTVLSILCDLPVSVRVLLPSPWDSGYRDVPFLDLRVRISGCLTPMTYRNA